jgi:hypothetical protein
LLEIHLSLFQRSKKKIQEPRGDGSEMCVSGLTTRKSVHTYIDHRERDDRGEQTKKVVNSLSLDKEKVNTRSRGDRNKLKKN